MPTDNADQINTNAQEPKSASGSDGSSATMHSIPDEIMADRYAASKAAVGRNKRGIIYQKYRGQGTV